MLVVPRGSLWFLVVPTVSPHTTMERLRSGVLGREEVRKMLREGQRFMAREGDEEAKNKDELRPREGGYNTRVRNRENENVIRKTARKSGEWGKKKSEGYRKNENVISKKGKWKSDEWGEKKKNRSKGYGKMKM